MADREKVLVTGVAGFIGCHLALRLLKEGYAVVGFDNLNSYYEISLKQARLGLLSGKDHFTFVQGALEDAPLMLSVFEEHRFDYVVNLAAQAGVRYSLINPHAYVQSNVSGFLSILEACKNFPVKHLLYASSSSVYGANTKTPFCVNHNVDHPISLYAATKKANELMAHSYSNLYNIPTTGLRFFTVYGPWGRPDMALFLFTKAILEGKPIDVFNEGKMRRDFTYIDDIVESMLRLLPLVPKPNTEWNGETPDPASSFAPYSIYNIGNSQPVELMDFIKAIEQSTGASAKINFLPMQPGDLPVTYADVSYLTNAINYVPNTSVKEGVQRFVNWYKSYYNIS